MITGCYDIQTARMDIQVAFTNTMGTVPYRGAGRPEAAYFIERAMDSLAAKLGMDPADVRKRNFIPPDRFPYQTVMGNNYDSGEYTRALDHALTRAGYAELRREQQQARAQGRLVGIGLASYVEICGFEDDETSDVVVGRRRQGLGDDGGRLARPGARDGLRPARGRRAAGARSRTSP